jgi:hypothetical protein
MLENNPIIGQMEEVLAQDFAVEAGIDLLMAIIK